MSPAIYAQTSYCSRSPKRPSIVVTPSVAGWTYLNPGDITVPEEKAKSEPSSSWIHRVWPLGVVSTALAGVAVVLLRGCWHRKLSWPVRAQGYSYRVCLGCGVKRLFDEDSFQSYGPYRYDLKELVEWLHHRNRLPAKAGLEVGSRPAS
jgi:hypothetical protein